MKKTQVLIDKKKQQQERKNRKNKLIKYSKMDKVEILNLFNTKETGYSDEYAEELLDKYGYNKIDDEEEEKWYVLLVKSFIDPFNMILFGIILISIFTDIVFTNENDYSKIVILSIIILISGVLHFVQKTRSRKSIKQLKAMVSNTTLVVREKVEKEIPLTEVVVGDIIKLSAGDLLPADLRIISCKDLFLSQSSLTGESEPIEKFDSNNDNVDDIFDLKNICYMGTNLVSGVATGIVIATGKDTYLGEISKAMTAQKNVTAFDKGVKKVTWLLIRITMVMVPIVFIINILTKGNVLDSFIYAMAIAVGVTPELLLVIVTSNLAKGTIEMAKKKTIIKNLGSIQNLGAMDILCTDKTGTLTQDHIILHEYLDVHGNEDMRILRHAFLNSYFQTGLKNLLDIAVINKAKESDLESITDNYEKIDEIPFDFVRRRMSIVIKDRNNKKQLITKGAVEEVLSICKYVEYNIEIKEIDDILYSEILKITRNLNQDGLRVVAVAQKNEIPHDETTFGVKDEKDMVLIGYVAFLDPPKETAKDAIKALNLHGVQVKVITGDNELVAIKVCKEVEIDTTYTLTGKQIEKMSQKELLDSVERTTLFAKISPIQKAEIVKALKVKGHIVGYMGDGINDAPALTQADVSISVDSGVDIAKEASDIILLEKSLMVLEEGIIEGRKVFANIMKYFKMATSSNVGNMISLIFASIFLPFLPMLPIHILLQNLLYDFSQIGIPFDNVDKEYLKQPKKWETKGISKFIMWFAPVSTIFDLVTFAVFWYILGVNTVVNQAFFHSGWFILGVLSQTIIVHVIRTAKLPFIQSRPSGILLLATLVISIITVIIPYTDFGSYVGLVPLPSNFLIWISIIMVGYIIVTEIFKRLYIKLYNEWI